MTGIPTPTGLGRGSVRRRAFFPYRTTPSNARGKRAVSNRTVKAAYSRESRLQHLGPPADQCARLPGRYLLIDSEPCARPGGRRQLRSQGGRINAGEAGRPSQGSARAPTHPGFSGWRPCWASSRWTAVAGSTPWRPRSRAGAFRVPENSIRGILILTHDPSNFAVLLSQCFEEQRSAGQEASAPCPCRADPCAWRRGHRRRARHARECSSMLFRANGSV